MVLCGVEDCYQDADSAFGVCSYDVDGFGGGGRRGRWIGVFRANGLRMGGRGTGEEGACEVADGGYDYCEVVTTVPEAVVGCLVAEDLMVELLDMGSKAVE